MQNKGAIRFFAIAFALVCLFQLSFTVISRITENRASKYARDEQAMALVKKLAMGDATKEASIADSIAAVRERYYLDSVSSLPVYNILLRKYTYKECKEREINLGLDLKGGMNVTLEVSVSDVVNAMSGYSPNPTFKKAMNLAAERQKNSQRDFVTLFGEAFKEVDPNAKLSAIFGRMEMRDKIKPNSTNEEVLKVIRTECNDAYERTYNILHNRIDRFGVTQPNIQKLTTSDRILIELPGIKEPERVRKLLQGTAKLEFWETYQFTQLSGYFGEANKRLAGLTGIDSLDNKSVDSTTATKAKADSLNKKPVKVADTASKSALLDKLKKDTTAKGKDKESFEKYAKENPLYAYFRPAIYQGKDGQYYPSEGSTVGYAAIKDTARVNRLLSKVSKLFPRNLILAWGVKPEKEMPDVLQLYALRSSNRENTASLAGDVIVDARQDYDQNGKVEVAMSMNSEGAKTWRNLTAANVGKQVAIVLDGYVYSAPRVNDEIPNGRSSITGNFSIEEGQDLATVLKSGKLPAPARIVEEAVVGPTLGKEAINAGLWSFVVAFFLTLLYMIFYYNRAGMIANVALFVNMLFVFGILASIGAVLTLPGIAGIVLTLGMDVDKNVIIYERIREEIRAGKGMRLAINDGYKHALTAIIDSNVTTLLTGIVLYVFGSGPVQGFATTLIIGILSSLFCAIFITRLLFTRLLDGNKKITVWTRYTENILTHTKIDFIQLRKTFYIISGSLVIIGIVSLFVRGLSYGIDFEGGRTYVVRFDQDVRTDNVRIALAKVYGKEPEVKTFGPNNQVKITTSFMIDDSSPKVDSIVENKLFEGLKPLYKNSISQADFLAHSDKKALGKMSSQKVQPIIAYSLLVKAYYAVFFSLLIIFAYIVFRFRKWQWGLGGVISLFHDTFIVLTLFSLLYGVLPFSLDIDQHFIAAILTIIGYSIMDSVIIFDRIREYTALYPKRDVKETMNAAINSTLGRTLNTSGITFMVLLAMFIFGGEVIRGFCFALMVGVAVGTYSSILNATPIAYDLIMWQKRRHEKKMAEAK
ncbi:MAG: protein translocase subunit SecDF [Bacteroidetes bacterium]|nr:protein translocase subunit SecDF [Bacteroidota bacterium]